MLLGLPAGIRTARQHYCIYVVQRFAVSDKFVDEMRLFDVDGNRLYLDTDERQRFLAASVEESPRNRLLCQVLHYTGCRPSEALETRYSRVLIEDRALVFRTLKKRKFDKHGRVVKPKYRTVPVPASFIEQLDTLYDIRGAMRRRKRKDDPLLWPIGRIYAYRIIKRVMIRADIQGPQATNKGLRHGFAVAMVQSGKISLPELRDLLGHASTTTTEIYLQIKPKDQRERMMAVWDEH